MKKKNTKVGRLLGLIICEDCSAKRKELSLSSRTDAEKLYTLSAKALINSPLRRITMVRGCTSNYSLLFLVLLLHGLLHVLPFRLTSYQWGMTGSIARWYLRQDLGNYLEIEE